jgi:hypothetical protein
MTLTLWIVAGALLVAWFSWMFYRRRRLRERRLVVCPETQEFEAIRLHPSAKPADLFAEESSLRLDECSRWPEACDCEQECRRQVSETEGACRVQTYLEAFYRGRSCVLCGANVSEWSDWADHSPGLRTPDGRAIAWQEIPLRELPAHLEVDAPLCWNCSVIERVVADHPDRITERPARDREKAKSEAD